MKILAPVLTSLLVLMLSGCRSEPEHVREGSGHVILQPVSEAESNAPARVRRTVYVPVYSSIYWGFDESETELGVTLSIRNVNIRQSILLHSATYFDSNGKKIREYVERPGQLAPLATADFVIQRRDTAGGPGANFLVEWSSAEEVDEPVIEAVMLGQHGNAGISFTSTGRTLHAPGNTKQ